MHKNKLVLQVPPGFLWQQTDLDKVKKTKWEIKTGSNEVMRKVSTVSFFGTREMWRAVEEGDFLVFIESPLDDLHYYAWNLHVMKEREYKEWCLYE